MKLCFNFLLICLVVLSTHSKARAETVKEYPPRDKGPVQIVTTQDAADQAALPKQNVTPESARTNKIAQIALAEIHVTILFGNDQKGKKSYKVDYKVVETEKDDDQFREPAIKISYKNKKEKEQFSVSEIFIKKNPIGTYKITATIVESKPGQKPNSPKVTWVD